MTAKSGLWHDQPYHYLDFIRVTLSGLIFDLISSLNAFDEDAVVCIVGKVMNSLYDTYVANQNEGSNELQCTRHLKLNDHRKMSDKSDSASIRSLMLPGTAGQRKIAFVYSYLEKQTTTIDN